MRWITASALVAFLAVAATAQTELPPPPPPPPFPRANFPGQPDHGFFPPSAAKQFKELIPALIEALKDSDSEVRQHTAMALAGLGEDAIKPLTEALKDPVKEKRAAAAYALGYMGFVGRPAVPDLLKVLKDDEVIVRRSASQALSRIVSGDGMMYGHGGAVGGFGGAPPVRAIAPALPELALPRTPPKAERIEKAEKPR